LEHSVLFLPLNVLKHFYTIPTYNIKHETLHIKMYSRSEKSCSIFCNIISNYTKLIIIGPSIGFETKHFCT